MPPTSFLRDFTEGITPYLHLWAQNQFLQNRQATQQDAELRRQATLEGIKQGVPADTSLKTDDMIKALTAGIQQKHAKDFQGMVDAATKLTQPQAQTQPQAITQPQTTAQAQPQAEPQIQETTLPGELTSSTATMASSAFMAPTQTQQPTQAQQVQPQVQQPQARPGLRLKSLTMKPGEQGSMVLEPPTAADTRLANEQEALKFDATEALSWINDPANAHIKQAFPGLAQQLQSNPTPEAIKHAGELQKNPYIQPSEEAIMSLYDAKLTHQERFAKAMRMFGNTDKVKEALSHIGSGVDIKNLTEKERSWAAILAAPLGVSPDNLPTNVAIQAKKNALAEDQAERQMNSNMALQRIYATQLHGADIQSIGHVGMGLVTKLGDEAQLLGQAKGALDKMNVFVTKLAKQATGTAWINKPLNAIVQSGQFGVKGTDLAMLEAWGLPVSQLMERGLFKMGARAAATLVTGFKKGDIPNGSDTPAVMLGKMKALYDMHGGSEKGWLASRDASVKVFNSGGLKGAGNAVKEGYYDIAKQLLESAATTPPPTPTEDPSMWAPSSIQKR